MAEGPAVAREPDLVAALEPHPAVVRRREPERNGGGDLDDRKRHEGRARAVEDAIDPPSRVPRYLAQRHATTRASRYQATVRAIPSRSETFAVNPNSSRARVTSRLRRGCPFGIELSQMMLPS